METCNFTVTILDQVANLILTCPPNLTITAAIGATDAEANWIEPNASSTCPMGTSTITQTTGPINGSILPIGVTTISYEGMDNCNNIETCSFTVTILDGGTNTGYCNTTGLQPWIEWMENVSFGDIDNMTSKDLYGDYTSLSTTVDAGSAYPISLTHIFSWDQFDEYFRVWIDFNQDGGFDDINETAFEMISPGNGFGATPITINGTINIPTTATNGPARMRVAMKRGAYADPCETFTFGEVEDYTVVINNTTNLVLPEMDLLRLKIQKTGTSTRLDWLTNTDDRNEYFIIERATNQGEFEVIEMTNSITDSTSPLYYSFVDQHPQNGKNTYRVKAILDDDRSVYSNIQTVFYEDSPATVRLYPNPAKDQIYLSMKDFVSMEAQIDLFNTLGQKVKSFSYQELPNAPIPIDLTDCQNGIYYLSIQIKNKKRITRKIIVERLY